MRTPQMNGMVLRVPLKFLPELRILAKQNDMDIRALALMLLDGALGWAIERRQKKLASLAKTRAAHARWRAAHLDEARRIDRDYKKSKKGKLARLHRPAQVQVRRKPRAICKACDLANDPRCRWCHRCGAELRSKLIRRSRAA